MRRALIAFTVLLLPSVCVKPARAQDAETLLKSPEANFRVEGAKRLAANNNKRAVETIVRALKVEQDGACGREMGATLKGITDVDALKAAEKAVGSPKDPGDFFAAFWALSGIAMGASPTGDAILQAALKKSHASDVSLRACALEAIGEAARVELAQWLIPLLNETTPAVDKGNAFETLALLSSARRLGLLIEEGKRKPLMEALIHVLDQAKDERVDYFAANALSKLTGQQPYIDPAWWRNYLVNGAPAGADQSRTVAKPTFFDAIAVGLRVLFVIDISGSMEWPADLEFRRKGPQTGRRKEGVDGPDYSGVRTKLDLAKVELIWTLNKLPEDMNFNIVVYEAKHRLIDEAVEGMVSADIENKTRFSNLVRQLRPDGGTNIHGSLMRAFRMTKKKDVAGDPALDKKAMLEGADTIFFLTDGEPSWSDDSTAYGSVHPKWGRIGNGKFCKPDAILADISRVNTFRKVVIHTVGISKDHAKDLLEKLAEQNHGSYVSRG